MTSRDTDVVSIAGLRRDMLLVTRGYFALYFFPTFLAFPKLFPMVRDLPNVDLGPLLSPTLWMLLALAFLFLLAWRTYASAFTKRALHLLLAGMAGLVAIGLAVAAYGVWTSDWSSRNFSEFTLQALLQEPLPTILTIVLIVALGVFLSLFMFYFAFISPARAVLRLLSVRLPPDGLLLTDALEAPRAEAAAKTHPASGRLSHARRAAFVFKSAAVILATACAVPVLWLYGNDHLIAGVAAAFASMYLVRWLWLRGRRHGAIYAAEVLRQDTRPPILYLRSFKDDAGALGSEWDALMQLPRRERKPSAGNTLRKRANNPLAQMGRRISADRILSARLEEVLAKAVGVLGPFVAIGQPDEPLPELGAARAYFDNDTWQDAVVRWIDMAQLIIQIAGPTQWVRWELDTILARGAWSKLLLLLPPGDADDRAARWSSIGDALSGSPWSAAFARLDAGTVVALRLLDGGRLRVITDGKYQPVDYLLAYRILLAPERASEALEVATN
jgi:hypothetical protein